MQENNGDRTGRLLREEKNKNRDRWGKEGMEGEGEGGKRETTGDLSPQSLTTSDISSLCSLAWAG